MEKMGHLDHLDPETRERAKALMHEAGYRVPGLPDPIPKGMWGSLAKFYRLYALVAVSLAVGAVSNLILFFVFAFLFAGPHGDKWVRWYFGSGAFLLVTGLVAVICMYKIRKLRLV
jgi:hypothetical protein